MAFPGSPTITSDGSFSTDTNNGSVSPGKPTGLAVGDLMIAHVSAVAGTISAPVGWTQIDSQRSQMAVFSKVADSSDVAASVFVFTSSNVTTNMRGIVLRITTQKTSSPITQSNGATGSGTTVTVSTITPTYTNSLWLFFLYEQTANTGFSAEAMATNNPSWTEHYDAFDAQMNSVMALAYALRTQNSASGNITATIGSSGTWGAIALVVAPIPDVSPAASTLALTSTVLAPASFILDNNIPVSPLALTATTPSPSVTTQEYPVFDNPSKSTTTWTNDDKTQ